jgi:hypothetical protein
MRAVLERDFLAEASRPRAFAVRCMLAAAVAALATALLAGGIRVLRAPPDVVGTLMFRGAGGALLLLLYLVTPPLVIGSILGERQAGTLPLVMATPISPAGFALAKLASRSGLVLLLALAVVPGLLLPLAIGGVGARHLVAIGGLAVALVLEMAATALWTSASHRKVATALMVSYLLPVFRWGLTLLVVSGWTSSRPWGPPPRVPDPVLFLLDTCPFGSFVRAFDWDPWRLAAAPLRMPGGGFVVPGPRLLLDAAWLPYLLYALVLGASAVRHAADRIAVAAEPDPPGALSPVSPRKRWVKRPSGKGYEQGYERIVVETFRGRLFRRLRGSPGTGNPLLWKESRLLDTAGSRDLYYRVLVALFVVQLAGMVAYLSTDRSALGVFSLQVTLVAVVAALHGAATFGHDRVQGTWDLLRVSPLTPLQVAAGKSLGAALGVGFLAVVPACHLLIGWAVGYFDLAAVALGFGVILFVPLAWLGVGLLVSLATAGTGPALARIAALLGGAALGLPVLGLGLEAYFHATVPAWPSPFPACAGASPPFAAFRILDWARNEPPGAGFGSVDALWIGAHVLLGLFLPFLLAAGLRERFAREAEEG